MKRKCPFCGRNSYEEYMENKWQPRILDALVYLFSFVLIRNEFNNLSQYWLYGIILFLIIWTVVLFLRRNYHNKNKARLIRHCRSCM